MDSGRSHRPSPDLRRTIGRRAVFFWAASLVCAVLIPLMPPEFRWVAWSTAGLGLFWAVGLSLEDLADARHAVRDRFEPAPQGFPFAPPPPRGREKK